MKQGIEMTTVLESAPDHAPARERRRWHHVALACIVALALALYVWGIGRTDLRNVFFSIGVRSMSTSFTNFLFGAWDPAGVMTLDKPPMAFWPQVLSVKVFGFHGWALVLPQVIEGGLAVFLLHRTVRRWAGENVALLAALLLAFTPITVVISRTNNTDTLLMLWCVAAAYGLMRAVQPETSDRSARLWLMQAALWTGCAFTTKMLAGWLIVPAIALAYLVGRKSSWPRRIVDLLCGTAVLAVSSLWWVLLTTFWPGTKPFEAGSTTGSTWNLVFVQNGWDRIVGMHEAAAPSGGGGNIGGGGFSPAAANVVTIGKAIGAAFNGGDLGLSRIFGRTVGGQITWLLPFALFVLVAVAVNLVVGWRRAGVYPQIRAAGFTMWAVWIVVTGLLFSYQQGTYHAYYPRWRPPSPPSWPRGFSGCGDTAGTQVRCGCCFRSGSPVPASGRGFWSPGIPITSAGCAM
jgi:4-amino-4-deoxy-L-arabinose transferase-like glycosyltransferase